MRLLDHLDTVILVNHPNVRFTPEVVGSHVVALSGIVLAVLHLLPQFAATAASCAAFLYYSLLFVQAFRNRKRKR